VIPAVQAAPVAVSSSPWAPTRPPRPHPLPAPQGPTRSILLVVVGVLVAAAVLASVGWRLAGGALFTIATPSMCPDLCVGTLVLDQPLTGPVHVGDVVTFRPPGSTTVFTHRVVRVLPGGAFKTAGDALGRVDPWTVSPGDVVGRVVDNVRDLGWLWRGLPWVAAALACILVARRSVAARFRSQFDLLAVTALAVVPALVMRPFVRAAVVAWEQRPGGSVVMWVVNTGLFPAQYRVTGAPDVTGVVPGQVLKLTGVPTRGTLVSLGDHVSFTPWQWAMFALVVLLPMLVLVGRVLWHRLRRPPLRLAPVLPAPAPFPPPPAPGWAAPGARPRPQPPARPLR